MIGYENKKINLVLTSDENYIKLLVPCIISILSNKKEETEIDIYILETGINEYHKKKIKELETFKGISNCKIEFLNAKEHCKNLVEVKVTYFYYTSAILYRLAIPSIFSNLDRALYIDVDTIVRIDLLDLYNQDFENNYCCASRSNPISSVSYIYDDNTVITQDYGISTGILLFNIKKILHDKKASELLDIPKIYPLYLPKYIDQDVIASVFKNKIKNIDISYNYVIENFDLTRERNKLSRKEYLDGIKKCKILHFAYSLKPMRLDKLQKLDKTYKEYYKYYQQSYLRINHLKLKLIFLLADLRRLRRKIIGFKHKNNGKKIFYLFNIELVFG